MTFNIGSQSGGVINNVGGNQIVSGSLSGISHVTLAQARDAAQGLQSLLGSADLPPPIRQELDGALAEVNRELALPQPDQPLVVHRLTRIVQRVVSAGSLIGSTKEIVGSLTTLAEWLGPAGAHLLGLLSSIA
jgi:hypothetical protein